MLGVDVHFVIIVDLYTWLEFTLVQLAAVVHLSRWWLMLRILLIKRLIVLIYSLLWILVHWHLWVLVLWVIVFRLLLFFWVFFFTGTLSETLSTTDPIIQLCTSGWFLIIWINFLNTLVLCIAFVRGDLSVLVGVGSVWVVYTWLISAITSLIKVIILFCLLFSISSVYWSLRLELILHARSLQCEIVAALWYILSSLGLLRRHRLLHNHSSMYRPGILPVMTAWIWWSLVLFTISGVILVHLWLSIGPLINVLESALALHVFLVGEFGSIEVLATFSLGVLAAVITLWVRVSFQ